MFLVFRGAEGASDELAGKDSGRDAGCPGLLFEFLKQLRVESELNVDFGLAHSYARQPLAQQGDCDF